MKKRIFIRLTFILALLALTAVGEEDPSVLLGTKWRLVGYVDVATGDFTEADRSTYWHGIDPVLVEESDNPWLIYSVKQWYTLEFDPMDFRYSGRLSSTEWFGSIESYHRYNVEYTSDFTRIFGEPHNVFEGGPGGVPEDQKYFYALRGAQTFELIDTTLKIYYFPRSHFDDETWQWVWSDKLEYLLFEPWEPEPWEDPEPSKVHESARTVSQTATGAAVTAVMMLPEITLSPTDLAAGPNPVPKSAGLVNFYRVGKQVKSSSLKVYNNAGKFIGKIAINDVKTGGGVQSQSKRHVGSWPLKDANGRPVPAGTYLVKGTVKTVDGKSERVSLIISVSQNL
ncbi:MAG: hypothetical protein LBC59_04840 [Chitinispirillales bacterium]|jgi:hypothetical protein|nr:hypothetical protein [Chitinispirillales bacterium]